MPYIDLPDARLFYDRAGEAGPPVLLIMGFGVPGHMWMSQIPALSERHQVAWFDNCGAGKTRRQVRRPYNMRDLARHAIGVLDALGWADAHVVGVSMGGMVAQEIALGHPQRVRSLSLLVTHAGGLRNLLPPLRGLALFARGFLGPRSQRALAIERLIFPDAYLKTRTDVGRMRSVLRDHVVDAASARDRLAQIAAVLTHRTARRLGALEGMPTLVVKAALDVLVRPSECHRLHRLIPGSRLVELPDAGHALLYQCADRINALLLEHLMAADAQRDDGVERQRAATVRLRAVR
jgi:pimeloyl-ACP methyl ester carboxylesterase